MIMSKRMINFVVAISVMFSGVSTSIANDSVKVSSQSYLSAGSAKSFNAFMTKTQKRFVKKNANEWVTFNSVVSLYNSSTGKFLLLSEVEQQEFLASTSAIQAKLAKSNSRDAKVWLQKIALTEKVFKFIWENKVEEKSVEQYLQKPVVKFENTIGR